MNSVTAVRGVAVVRETKVVETNVITYTLTIPESVAKTLRSVCGRIAGSPKESYRRDMNSISEALESAGLQGWHDGRVVEGSLIMAQRTDA